MSQENVEIVRRSVEAWQRDDFEAFLSVIHPEIEWHTALERLVEGAGSVYRGHEGIREFWTTYRTELEDFEVETQELRPLENNRVLHLCHIRWRGPASGIELESPVGIVNTMRDGKRSHDASGVALCAPCHRVVEAGRRRSSRSDLAPEGAKTAALSSTSYGICSFSREPDPV